MAKKDPKLSVTVDSADGATFPYAWYFRDLDVGYLDMTTVSQPPDSDVLVMTEGGRARLAPALGAYTGRKFPFRVWWVRDYSKMSIGNWWRWFTRRKPWNPTGGLAEYLYTRRDITRERGAEALHGRDAAAGLDRVLRRAGAGHRARVVHDDHEAPEARRVVAALDDLEDVGAEPQERHPLVAAAEVEAGVLQRRDGAVERAGEDDDVVDGEGAVGMRGAVPARGGGPFGAAGRRGRRR